VDWRVFDNPTALVSYYYRAGASQRAAAFLCHYYFLRMHLINCVQLILKLSVQISVHTAGKKFILSIWEERNLGRYEHARACRERARARRARNKSTSLHHYYYPE
jgi:hypothetical protein